MHENLLSFGKGTLRKTFFIVYCFFSSCTSPSEAEAFLKKLLLEEGGIYTLLGDKPITDVIIFTGTENDVSLANLSQESLQNIEFVEDHTFENWLSWKKIAKTLKLKSFAFAQRTCPHDPLHTMYMLVNIDQLKRVLSQYKQSFKRVTGSDYTIDEVLKSLNDAHSIFWDKVFKDHYLSGILHGYGESNARHFSEACNERHFSEKFEGKITSDHFPLPTFAVSENDKEVKKYMQDRERIKMALKDKNFFKTAVQLLQK